MELVFTECFVFEFLSPSHCPQCNREAETQTRIVNCFINEFSQMHIFQWIEDVRKWNDTNRVSKEWRRDDVALKSGLS